MNYFTIRVEYPDRFSKEEVEKAIIGQLDLSTFEKIGVRLYKEY